MSIIFKIILITLLTHSKAYENFAEIFLEDDLETMKMIPDEQEIEDGVSKTMHIFSKYKVQKEMIATILRVERKMVYCPAMLNLMTSETCYENITFLTMPLNLEEKILKERKCPISRLCNKKSCDGISIQECEDATIVGTQTAFADTEPEISSSFLYHRCSTGFKCTLLDVNLYLNLMNKTHIAVEGDLFKECVLPINSTKCSTSNGWEIYLREKVKLEVKSIAVSCLKGNKENLCWDKEENSDFFQDENGCGRINNNLYLPGMEIVTLDANPSFGEGMASLKDLKDIYRVLQFENLQSSYNIILLRKELNKMKRLISSIIYFGFKITTDPLQMYKLHESKILRANRTHISLTARITKKDQLEIGNIDNGKSTKTTLFPGHDFSKETIGSKTFRIQQYDEYSLEKMFKSITDTKVDGSNFKIENPLDLLASLKSIYYFVSPFILIFCFITQMCILNLMMRRVANSAIGTIA